MRPLLLFLPCSGLAAWQDSWLYCSSIVPSVEVMSLARINFPTVRSIKSCSQVPVLAAIMILAGCSFGGEEEPEPSVSLQNVESSTALFAPESYNEDEWRHVRFSGETKYETKQFDDRPALRATADDSASILIRRVRVDPNRCRYMEINWASEDVQGSANLHEKSGDDVAGSILIAFGDPGTLLAPNSIPVLRYVWTNELHNVGDVIDSPYLPGVVKSIVLRTGEDNEWRKDTRDLVADFQRAFDREPDDVVYGIAIMTDNDQTAQPVEFYYGEIRTICAG